MKKLSLLCALAFTLAGDNVLLADTSFPDTVGETKSLEIPSEDYMCTFGANDQKIQHDKSSGARHLSSSVSFELGSFTGLEIISNQTTTPNSNGDEKNSFGFNGAYINGDSGGVVSLTKTSDATAVWVGLLNITGGATVNLNYGEDILQKANNSTINLSDNSTLVQNSRRTENSTTNFLFKTTGTTATGNVLFTSESLTSTADKGNVIMNTSLGTGITATFDSSFASGSNITFYTNNSGTVDYTNTFKLNGQNVNIYAQNATAAFKVENESSTTTSKVYLEAGTIAMTDVNTTFLEGGSNTEIYLKGQLTGADLSAKGNGKKTIELTADSTITKGSDHISGAMITLKSAGEERKTLTMGSRINVSTGYNLVNAKILVNKAYSGGTEGNNSLILNMDSKSMFETTGGLRLNNGSVIAGEILVKGTGRPNNAGPDDFMFAINATTDSVKIQSTANITQKFEGTTSKSRNWIQGKVVVENGAKVKLADDVYLNNAIITLNGGNAFNIGMNGSEFNSQAKSTLLLDSHSGATGNTEFIINAANEIGSFKATQTGHSLILSFGENGSLVIGADETLDALVGDFNIQLKGEVSGTQLKVYDLAEEDKSRFTSVNDEYTVVFNQNDDGSYYITATTAVPEPAEWAMILGAMALMFTFLKRKNK